MYICRVIKNKNIMRTYTLKVGGTNHEIDAVSFEQALKKLNEKLNTSLTENQVRITSVTLKG